MDAWDLFVERDDLTKTELVHRERLQIADGETLLKVDRVGMTANNVTYALVGDSMKYWEFFPAPQGRGRVPLWGFCDVVESNAPGVEVGSRFYGYLPPSSHLVVSPDRSDEHGFRDAGEHRAKLPGAYNIYSTTTGDPSYEADREDLQILYRPLFITSFMLEDFLADNAFFGAEQVVVSSASSKTAYGMAFCARMREAGPRLVGLTSAGNVAFTESLGCYDEVVCYEELEKLDSDAASVYADMAGSVELRRRVHEHFANSLRYDAVVGATHLAGPTALGAGDVSGVRPTFFFAPDQISKRRTDWGPRGIETRFGATWKAFVPTVETWVDIVTTQGPKSLEAAWLEVLSGKSDPRVGNVIQL